MPQVARLGQASWGWLSRLLAALLAWDEGLGRPGANQWGGSDATLRPGLSCRCAPIPLPLAQVLSCPPYFDLEQYGGGDGDLSMMSSCAA